MLRLIQLAIAALAWLGSAGVGRGQSVTFVCASDTHWMVPDGRNDAKRQIVASMNGLAGKRFPAALGGGAIGRPLGVLVAGDLVDGGRDAKEQWANWRRDFGLTGDDGAVLKLPVYETWGNHDGGKLVPDGIAARNRKRVGVANVSAENGEEGVSYSWDWGSVHLVSVGFYPAKAVESKRHPSPGYDPRGSLEFLVEDLRRNVGESGRPVILMQHVNLPNDSDEWWTAAQRSAYYEAIKGYNVVAIVDGHEAGGPHRWRGIDVLGCNDLVSGYWVVQVEGNRLVAARTTDGERWGKTLSKTIELGRPREAKAGAGAATQPSSGPAR